MLNELKIDELLDKVDSRYGLVLVAARRARQINEYAATLGLNESLGIPGPQVHTRSQHPLSISFEELRADKLEVEFRKPPEEADEEGVGAVAAAGDDFLNPAPGASPAPAADAAESSDEGAA
jgi:DNA-directed RNA polymerase subunit omega